MLPERLTGMLSNKETTSMKREDAVPSKTGRKCDVRRRPTEHEQLQLALVLPLQVVGDDDLAEVDAAVAPPQLPDTKVGFCRTTMRLLLSLYASLYKVCS